MCAAGCQVTLCLNTFSQGLSLNWKLTVCIGSACLCPQCWGVGSGIEYEQDTLYEILEDNKNIIFKKKTLVYKAGDTNQW